MTAQPSEQTGADVEIAEDEISILDLLVVLARQKRTVVRTVMWFGIVGLLIAVFSSSEYTSSATVIREVEDGSGAASSALDALRGFGIGVGGASSGLTADAYPDIVKSREVRLAVARDTFRFSGRDEEMTFVEYVDRYPGFFSRIREYTIGLPGKIVRAISGAPALDFAGSSGIMVLTAEEENTIERISEMLRTSEDLDSGLMTISVISNDRLLSVQLALSFVDQLVERVRAVYTEKSRQNLDFIQERFEEAELKLAGADSALAQFEDRNVGVTSARLETERQRLQRQVTFKTQLYSDLQTQLTHTEIELQRAEPVITVLERPVAPLEASGPRRSLTLVLFL
ncbi:MAG: chain-length determining protein, partial [Bacteroidetes bacterium]|nr:chain-length determining protein [Bacteroidota bacterium]